MFVLCKIFSGNAIFGKGKCIQAVWLPRNSFYGNQFQCLVRSNILRKMLSVLRKINYHVCSVKHFTKNGIHFLWKINSHVCFVDHFTKNMNALQILAPALPKQTCNTTKLIIHFNIKNNHPNSSTCIA